MKRQIWKEASLFTLLTNERKHNSLPPSIYILVIYWQFLFNYMLNHDVLISYWHKYGNYYLFLILLYCVYVVYSVCNHQHQKLDKEPIIDKIEGLCVKHLCQDHPGGFQFWLKTKCWRSREILFIAMAHSHGDKVDLDWAVSLTPRLSTNHWHEMVRLGGDWLCPSR